MTIYGSLSAFFKTLSTPRTVSNAVMSVHLHTLKVKQSKRSRTSFLLVQVAAADLLTCLTVAPVVGGNHFVLLNSYNK